jgi:hypothetical protein
MFLRRFGNPVTQSETAFCTFWLDSDPLERREP